MERDREISKSVEDILREGDNYPPIFRTALVEEMVEHLDHDGIISWWLWDGPDAGKESDKFAIYLGDPEDEKTKRFPVRNAGDLYDYIMEVKGE